VMVWTDVHLHTFIIHGKEYGVHHSSVGLLGQSLRGSHQGIVFNQEDGASGVRSRWVGGRVIVKS
jgi:hypothetical protein